MVRGVARSVRRAAGLIAVVIAAALLAPAAWASTPFVDIHSTGSLSDIYIGNDLSCQVRSGGFSSTEFFPNASGPGDCGTFMSLTVAGAGSQLYGPDFVDHAAGTAAPFPDGHPYTAFTPVSQTLTGAGTPASPYRLTTTVAAATTGITISQVDSYVVGDDHYQTDTTVLNGTATIQSLAVVRAADCQLRGLGSGYGFLDGTSAPACAANPNNSPSSAHEEFVPITASNEYVEASAQSVWSDVASQASLPDAVDPNGNPQAPGQAEDNAEAIRWSARIPAGQSHTFSMQTVIVDTVPTGGFSLTGSTGGATSGTVATINDPNTSATASAYSATIKWGDGSSSAGTITGGNGSFTVAGNHSYATAGTYPVAVTITSVGTSQGSSTVNDTATISAVPATVTTGAPPSIGGTSAAFTGLVNPGGLATTAFFEYGLDPKYTGAGPLAYTQTTPAQAVGSDFASHIISASVTGLVPNALYHVRLVATNNAGTTVGPDMTFTTTKTPAPGTPAIGKTFNIAPVSGVVLILLHGQLVPVTEVQQIPKNTLIDALHGTISLTTALPSGTGGAHDASAGGKKKKKPKIKTQSGTFGGAIFKISQATRGANKGLAKLTLVENAFKGAPSYAKCNAQKAADATAAALSSKTLQLLHASAHGKFRTSGKYSAATVRGTKWTIADKCNGTLTHDITDSVAVSDFVRHRTIVLHAGQSYLAKAPKRK